MNVTYMILGAIALGLLIFAFTRGRELPLDGFVAGGRSLLQNLPIILLGFLIAGLIQVLIPREMISQWLGEQAGIRGVLAACVAGGIVPGAPAAVFPIIGGFYKAGASLGAVVGFVSAWALWSLARLPVEMALIDPKAALVRFGVTLIVPPLAGLVTHGITRFF